MTKPVNFDELLLRIGALLRRAKIATSHRLEVGRFVMDLDEHTAQLGDEEIALTVREFNILYKLLSYPKKTFSRQQLMDEFWDADTNSGTRTVDVYMTKLRAKLSECDDFEIKTVHGLGYIFRGEAKPFSSVNILDRSQCASDYGRGARRYPFGNGESRLGADRPDAYHGAVLDQCIGASHAADQVTNGGRI